ncbi:hypothetical protein NKI88_20530 [Mesorhizobium sp. M0317]|uniref:hypothetical protein n=1 Tax=unclassified Mesorhizobium TaxID=325217 RepID=UPI0012ECA45F|nr:MULTISPECIES: hypothetical protein [unclassified Mesorhizobium]WJI50212.1 hypothetical protein NLY44_27090 [Mesorhizobium sp. C089B]
MDNQVQQRRLIRRGRVPPNERHVGSDGATIYSETTVLADRTGGWLVRAGMNRGNARLNGYALDHLQLVTADRAVEVGFGGAVLLPQLNREAAFVCGVDRSQMS